MFTGIIEHVGRVESVRESGGSMRLAIDAGPLAQGLGQGDSMAVNGVCLTVSGAGPGPVEFDAVSETLGRTTLATLRSGQKVNLERAMRADGRFDGHLVQGHVDGIAKVRAIQKTVDWITEFSAAPELLGLMVPKGSVAIDGVSLTITGLDDESFGAALIPTTLSDTTLAKLSEGQEVNVETDVVGKYVRRYLAALLGQGDKKIPGGLTIDKLREAGFI